MEKLTSNSISIDGGDGSQISSVALSQQTTPIGYSKGCYILTEGKGANCYQYYCCCCYYWFRRRRRRRTLFRRSSVRRVPPTRCRHLIRSFDRA